MINNRPKKRNSMKKRLLREAAENHISKAGPSTAVDICYYGYTNAGKMLKNYKAVGVHHNQAFSWLKADKDFIRLSDNRFKMTPELIARRLKEEE